MQDTQDTTVHTEVQIPPTAVVACPLKGFNLARVERCPECQYFAGLADRFPGSTHEFKVRYLLQCSARPTSREIKELA